jgi:hypothetical protein
MATRREFLLNCSALAATAALAPTGALAARPQSRHVHLDDISASGFAAQLNTRFVLRDAAGNSATLVLASVEPFVTGAGVASVSGGAPYENFSLFFVGDVSRPLRQGTYAFEHTELGQFEMFIVPVGRSNEVSFVCQAAFARPMNPAHARGGIHTR